MTAAAVEPADEEARLRAKARAKAAEAPTVDDFTFDRLRHILLNGRAHRPREA